MAKTIHTRGDAKKKTETVERKTFNSRGIPTTEGVHGLRSYEDFKKIKDYFLETKQSPRNYLMLVLGCATALRISDICALKIKDVYDRSNSCCKPMIKLTEQKTGKSTSSKDDDIIITEVMSDAIILYLDSLFWCFNDDDYLLRSQKPNKDGIYKLETESCHRIMKDAQRNLGFDYEIGTHTLRKTFSTISFTICACSRHIQGVLSAAEWTSLQLRHSSTRQTLRYIEVLRDINMSIRKQISDFLLGKSDIKSLQLDYEERIWDQPGLDTGNNNQYVD